VGRAGGAVSLLLEGRGGKSATVGCLSRSSCVVTTFGPLTQQARAVGFSPATTSQSQQLHSPYSRLIIKIRI